MSAKIEAEIVKAAGEIASRLEAQAARLNREYLETQKQATDLKAKRDAASLAPKRLADFQVTLGTSYNCPRCWVEGGLRSALGASPSDSRDDAFRCDTCHYEILIQY